MTPSLYNIYANAQLHIIDKYVSIHSPTLSTKSFCFIKHEEHFVCPYRF